MNRPDMESAEATLLLTNDTRYESNQFASPDPDISAAARRSQDSSSAEALSIARLRNGQLQNKLL